MSDGYYSSKKTDDICENVCGQVSLVDMEGPKLLFQQHIASEISTGIISLQFETCNLHGFEKNVLVVATKDSSVLARESDTENFLSTSTVRPNRPSSALFMQVLEHVSLTSKQRRYGHLPKQSFVLICSEEVAYLYSLNHVVQGVKKVYYKFSSSSCCWASTICSASDVGLVLAVEHLGQMVSMVFHALIFIAMYIFF